MKHQIEVQFVDRLPAEENGDRHFSIRCDNRSNDYLIPREIEFDFKTWVSTGKEYDGNGEFDNYLICDTPDPAKDAVIMELLFPGHQPAN
jgi:hypothetical protein